MRPVIFVVLSLQKFDKDQYPIGLRTFVSHLVTMESQGDDIGVNT